MEPIRQPRSANFIIWIFVLALVALGSYYLGTRKVATHQPTQSSNTPQVPIADTVTEKFPADVVGVTTWSFAEVNGIGYIKQATEVLGEKGVERPKDTIYTEDDQSQDPKEVMLSDANTYPWKEILKEPVKDFPESVDILVSDRLFSFKMIPNTQRFLFVVDLGRSAGTLGVGGVFSYKNSQDERDVSMYDISTGVLTKITSFPYNVTTSTYPKINAFSADGTYVALHMYGCWNCGGSIPNTLVLNLETKEMKDIGNTKYFAWKQDGNYEYKEVVVIPCKNVTPEEMQYPCYSDTASMKTGKI